MNQPSRWFQCSLNVETHCCKLREELWIPSSLRTSLWIFRGAEEGTHWKLAPHSLLWGDFPLSRLAGPPLPQGSSPTFPPACGPPPPPAGGEEIAHERPDFFGRKLPSSSLGCCCRLCWLASDSPTLRYPSSSCSFFPLSPDLPASPIDASHVEGGRFLSRILQFLSLSLLGVSVYCPGPPGVPQCHLSQSKAQSQQRCAGCPTASVGPAGLVWSCDFPILSRCWACRHGWGSPRATDLGAVAWTGIGSGVTSKEGDSRQSSLPFLHCACEHSRGDARPCASHLFHRVTCLPACLLHPTPACAGVRIVPTPQVWGEMS